jgi:hypothetical protein
MNYWVTSHCAPTYGTGVRPTLTEEMINKTFDNIDYTPEVVTTTKERTPKKHLQPQGFTVESGTQENFIQMVLHMRRLQTWQQGLRFQDLKRYGIAFSHNISGGTPIVFKAGDSRGAFQIPQDAIEAGIAPNVYENANTSAQDPDELQERAVRF